MSFDELLNMKITTASKHAEKLSEIPASAVIITRENIEQSGYRSLQEILQDVPGFYMIDDYFWLGSENFGVRGFFSTGTFNDVFIMVNDVNQIGDSWGDYPFSKINIPVEAIDRVEVVRGPRSVMYGSGAFLGAINIITNQSAGTGQKVMFSGSAGTLESKSFFARIADGEENLNYVFNAGFTSSGGLDVPFEAMVQDPELLNSVGLTEKATTNSLLEKDGKYFNFSGRFRNVSLDIGRSETGIGVFDGIPSTGDGTKVFTDATNIAVSFTRQINKKFSIKAKTGFFQHHYDWNYEMLFEDSYAINQVTTKAYEAELNAFLKPSASTMLTLGLYRRNVYYFYQNYDYPVFSPLYANTELILPDGDDIITDAFFSEFQYTVNNSINIRGGLRMEKYYKYGMISLLADEQGRQSKLTATYHNNDIKLIPSISCIFTLNDKNLIKAMYGEAVKQPSIKQNFSLINYNVPQLMPARMKTMELNYLFQPINRINTNISIFRNELDNLITKKNQYDVEKKEWILYSSNTGHMHTNGAEASIHMQLLPNWMFSISGVYQKSENPNEKNIELGYSPNFLGYFQNVFHVSENIHFSFSGRYIDKMNSYWDPVPKDPANADFSPIGRIGNNIEKYWVFNSNLRIENIFTKGMFCNLSCFNMFDKCIRYPATKSNDWAVRGTFGKPRLIRFGIGWKH